ncbi:2-methyl-3-hydroxypyridine 5-carboxylic acid dioxygenase [Spinactinospora alkalitolerans]|uniref:2-methyl-3-hydroxypyridine 5-carboxylic acid dioxygenase n=1 Tax=Spinactinospora alkalitolerans TaxID=687207 RepID=A0A852TMD2_9ACTN|nr:NAD(P)/FAD-dependent oxidoreductase [Spinactinospora alkalitolerans]NYE45436.1 2-methyl-3-hydroxypyridine 5-carboxylic acid dioxygenase [Spinactinospora alkalitolerans]
MTLTTSNNGRHAEVAGAGFAGLTAATALARRGWTVCVHEKGEDLREQGAGIVLWHNSIKVLEAIGAYTEAMSDSMTPPYYETRVHGSPVSHEHFDGLPWRTMTRPHLHRSLLSAALEAGVEIRSGSEVVSADPAGSITLASGETRTADLVVGADGVRSKVRDSIGFEQERWKSGDGIIRFLVPRHKDELGPGEWDNVIDFWNLEPRYLRVLYVPCNERELYIALGAPRSDEQGSRTPVDLDLWTSAFPELTPVLKSAAVAEDARYYGYQTTVLQRWTRGRVALVGDSAHAMCPALAQGAGTAMANAYTLAEAATGALHAGFEHALEEWERRERPITDRCQQRSADYAATRGMAEGNQFGPENLEAAVYDPTSLLRHADASRMER